MALTRRNAQERLVEPLYEFKDVPRCMRDLSTSEVIKIDTREDWMRMLPELLLLCNEAQNRFDARCHELVTKARAVGDVGLAAVPPELTPIHTGKALSLEYITDRMDLDDPLHGYVVRTAREKWMQGFITISTFTSWQRWFRWDSLVDEAGVLMHTAEGPGLDSMHAMGLHLDKPDEMRWWSDRAVDASGVLSAALNAEVRDGDPDVEGVIWPHVAELSLLGGVGCGSFLVNLVIEELESAKSPYNYIVMQATENSVPFYEKHGFVRVGAVARYFENPSNEKDKAGDDAGQSSPISTSPVKIASLKSEDKEETGYYLEDEEEEYDEEYDDQDDDQDDDEDCDDDHNEILGKNCSVPRRKTLPRGVTAHGSGSVTNVKNEPNTSVPKRARPSRTTRTKLNGVNKSTSGLAVASPSDHDKSVQGDASKIDPVDIAKASTATTLNIPTLTGSSSKFKWSRVDASVTPTIESIAKTFNVLPEDVVFMNRRLYGEKLNPKSHMIDGSMVRIPVFPSFFDPLTHRPKFQFPPAMKSCDTRSIVANDAEIGSCSSNGLWYRARDNETPRQIASKLCLNAKEIIACNAKLYPDLSTISPLMENTLLRLPCSARPPKNACIRPEVEAELERTRKSWTWGSDDTNQVNLSDVMTYRHWAFSDDPVDYSLASYMMVRPLNKRPPVAENKNNSRSGRDSPVEAPAQRKGVKARSLANAGKTTTATAAAAAAAASAAAASAGLKWTELAHKRFSEDGAMPLVYAYGADSTKCLAQQIELLNKDPAKVAKETAEAVRKREAAENREGYPKSIKISLRCPTLQRLRDRVCPLELRQGPINAAARIESAQPGASSSFSSSASGKKRQRFAAAEVAATSSATALVTSSAKELKKAKIIACDNLSQQCIKVFVRGSPFVGVDLVARLDNPLKAALPELVEPSKPKVTCAAYVFFSQKRRPELRKAKPEWSFSEVSTALAGEWRLMDETLRAPYAEKAEQDRARYARELNEYADRLAFYHETSEFRKSHALEAQGMVNQVIRLHPKPCKQQRKAFVAGLENFQKEHPEVVEHCLARREVQPEEVDEEAHEYFYVLTYIPDLLWCRLAPMHRAGTFTDKRLPRHLNRTKWTLIPEGIGGGAEIDVSSARCEIVHSVAVKNSQDADHEEWDILESRSAPTPAPK